MMTTRPVRAGRPGRAAPGRWAARVGLAAVSLAALLSPGCASFGGGGGATACGGSACGGGCGGKCNLGARLTSFNLRGMFHRNKAVAADSCDGSLGAIPVDGGVGAFPSGPVLQAPPPGGSDPDIQPLPGNGGSLTPPSGGSAGPQGSNSKNVKSLYQTRMDATRGEAQQARREAAPTRDPLADIPTFSSPTEAAPSAEASPPVAPTAGDRPSADAGARPADTSAGVGPGIRRFKVIEPRLAIGTLPGENGWEWLSELGYRTVIDLRQPSEVQPGDLAAINHQGLRYLAIPMSTTAIDPAVIARLEAEFARPDSRPIYVFDGDGLRPASVGFLHLVNVRKSDARTAEREVEEMGAADSLLWKATLVHQANQSTTGNSASTPALPKVKDPAPPSSSLTRSLSLWDAIKPSRLMASQAPATPTAS